MINKLPKSDKYVLGEKLKEKILFRNTLEKLKKIETLLNNRPRKCLGYLTPLESYQQSRMLQ